jgi:hypothetical protein
MVEYRPIGSGLEAEDYFNFNCSRATFVPMAGISDSAGTLWHGSEADLGTLEAAYLHASAATPLVSWSERRI